MSGKAPPKGPRALRGGPPPPPSSIAGPSSTASGPSLAASATKKIPTGPRSLSNPNAPYAGRTSKVTYRNGTPEGRGAGINGGINGVGTKNVHSSTSSTNADTWIPNGAVNGVKTLNSQPVPGILGSNRAAISFSMPRRPSGSGPPPPTHPPPPPPQPTKSPPPPPPPSSTPPPPPPPATPPPPPPSIDPPPPPPPSESVPPPPPPEVPPPPPAVSLPTSTPPQIISPSENIASSSSHVPLPSSSPLRRPPSPPRTSRPVSPVPPSPSPPPVSHFTPIALTQRVASPSPQPPSDILSPSSPRELTPPPPPPSPPQRRRTVPMYGLPPLPDWPPRKSDYPPVRSYKVLHDPSIHKLPFPSNVNDLVGYSSDGPPAAPGASSSTALTPPYFHHLISCMPEYVSASVFQDRVKGKGKGKEIVYRYEGEVLNRGEWIPVPGHGDIWIREPEIPEKPPDPRLNSNVKRRPPREELGHVTYEYEYGISTTPPPPTALLLTNLSPLTSNTQLRTHLGGYGPIKVFEPKIDKENGMALGVVWVDFRTHEDAKRCFDGICGPGLDIRGIAGSLKTLLGASAEDVKVMFDGQGKRVAAVIKELEDRKRKRKEAVRKNATTKDTPPLPTVPTPKQNGTPRPNAATPSSSGKSVYHPLPSNPRLPHALPPNPTKQLGPAVGSSSLALHNPLKASPMRPAMANGTSGPLIPQLQKAREAAAAEMKHEKEKTTEKQEGTDKRRMMDSFKAKPRERLREWERRVSDGRRGRERYDHRYPERRARSPSPNPLQYLHKGYTEDEVEKALLTNGMEYIIVEFEDGKRSGGGVSEGEVRDFFEDFTAEKVMSAPKYGLVFVTFTDPESARRALVHFAGSLRRLAHRDVKLRPGEKGVFHGFDGRRRTVWEDAEMVEEASRLLVAELKQILTKDVKDRVVGNEVKRLMRAGVREKEDEKEGEKGAKTLDLKGLSFRKRRREGEDGGRESKRAKVVDENVDVHIHDDTVKVKRAREVDVVEEEEEEERPRKKGKIEKVQKRIKGKKDRVVVEVEEEDVVVVVNGRKTPNIRSESTLSPSTSRASSPSSVPPTPALVVESESESEEEEEVVEEEDLGVFQDDEDRFFAKIALSHPEKDFESLDDNLKAELGIPPPPVITPRLRIHATGSARTEGFYEISHAQKAEYVSQYQARSSAASSKVVVDPAPNDSPSKAGVTSSRENRANARRRAQGLEEMNQLNRAVALSKSTAHMNSKDNPAQEMLLKFNQLQSRKKHLRFARSPIHDWGLYAMERISRGEMVIEYVGEIVRAQVAEKREKAYERQGIGSSYLFRIDEDLVVDATKKGNLGRLINHSCDPNCTAKIITISGEKKIVIYAKQDIELGDEITYDYHFPFEQDKIPCLCGSAKCRGFLN